MSYGLQCFDASGRITFDSTTAAVGCLADTILLEPGAAAQVRTYPNFGGRSALVMSLVGEPGFGVTSDTSLGYPRVTVPANPYGNQLYVVFVT